MTWESIGKALVPTVQSAIYSLLTMIAGAAITYVLYGEKAPAAPPIAQRTVSTVPVKTAQSDQTRLQLVGLQNTLDQIAEIAREINSKDCVVKPQRAAAKAK